MSPPPPTSPKRCYITPLPCECFIVSRKLIDKSSLIRSLSSDNPQAKRPAAWLNGWGSNSECRQS